MTYRTFRATLFALALASLPANALAQGSLEVVYYRDHGQDNKVVRVEGNELKETLSAVEVIGGDKKRKALIATPDIVRIDYGNLPNLDRTAQQSAIRYEDGSRDPAKATAEYATLVKAAGTTPAAEKTRRHLGSRELMNAVAASAAKPLAEFQKESKGLADRLVAFARLNKKGWEVWPSYSVAARLYAESDDWKAAGDTMGELAAVPDLTPELQATAKLGEVDYRLRAANYVDARSALADAEKGLKGASPALAERVEIYKAALAALPAREDATDPAAKKFVRPTEAVGKIEAVVTKSKDATVRATGYGVLGELYLAHKLPRDAMWSFLWVDTVYNQDKTQHVLAVLRLIDVFRELGEKDGDKSRADQFSERLSKVH